MSQPPSDYEEGEEIGDVNGVRLPAIGEDVDGGRQSVLFVPADAHPADILNVKVVKLSEREMGLTIQRRC